MKYISTKRKSKEILYLIILSHPKLRPNKHSQVSTKSQFECLLCAILFRLICFGYFLKLDYYINKVRKPKKLTDQLNMIFLGIIVIISYKFKVTLKKNVCNRSFHQVFTEIFISRISAQIYR